MLNKKGFTIAEVIVSFSMISIILTSIVAFAVNYRDKLKNEEVVSQLMDYKYQVTKAIYDDMIKKKYIRIEKCVGNSSCVNFIDVLSNVHTLRVEEVPAHSSIHKGVYLSYDGVKYMLPDSDITEGNQYLANFDGRFTLTKYLDKIYTLKISYTHYGLNKTYDINITLSRNN